MNIFALSNDVSEAARYHVDRHAVKMILEYAQLLSTAHRVLDGKQSNVLSKTGRRATVWTMPGERHEHALYKATHINHPSAIWARESVENYRWLQSLLVAVSAEYTFRYGREHVCKSSGLIELLETPPQNIPHVPATKLRLAMPEEYHLDDPVEAYRNYYRYGKPHLHSWKKREVPSWI